MVHSASSWHDFLSFLSIYFHVTNNHTPKMIFVLSSLWKGNALKHACCCVLIHNKDNKCVYFSSVLPEEMVSPEGLVSIIPQSLIAVQDEDVQFRCITGFGPDVWNSYLWLSNTSNYLCASSECSYQQTYPNLTSKNITTCITLWISCHSFFLCRPTGCRGHW